MKVKEIILAIAIIVLTIFVTFYGINTLFPSPDYNNFCKPDRVSGIVNTTEKCDSVGGRWNPTYYNEPAPAKDSALGYCDVDYTCRQEFDLASKYRSRNVFFLALPIGIAIIALGAFFFGLESVGAGLMGGGIGTLIYGSGAYWPYSENWLRFLISLIGLILLIWLAYFFNKKFGKKRKKRK
jgi:hypothetical protein